MRILLVEDEVKLGTSIESFLDKAGYAVDWVHDVKSALQALAAEAPEADLTLAVRPVPDRSRFGSVLVAGNVVTGLEEKGPSGPGLVNAGLYVLRQDLPARFPLAAPFSLETEVLAHPGRFALRALRTDAPFLDIGTPEDFARAQSLIPDWSRGD